MARQSGNQAAKGLQQISFRQASFGTSSRLPTAVAAGGLAFALATKTGPLFRLSQLPNSFLMHARIRFRAICNLADGLPDPEVMPGSKSQALPSEISNLRQRPRFIS